MKKTILSIITVGFLMVSCTQNERVKSWGGEGTINLPKGRKLVNATWKGDQIWYLTRPMNSKDVAETYQFQEESSWGVVEGSFNIIEEK
jgi:hypothetical protein